MVEEEPFKQTWTEKQRQARISLLIDEIKTKQKILQDDLYRFALRKMSVSKRAIDSYIKELELKGLVEVGTDFIPDKVPNYQTVIKWVGDKGE